MRKGYTLIETVVTSGILFLMVGLASMATIFYLRSYRHYTAQSVHVRLSAKTLEVACYRLRSARQLLLPIPPSLQADSLRFIDSDGGRCSLKMERGKLWLQSLDPEGKVSGSQSLGSVQDLQPRVQGEFLVLRAPVQGASLPLETQIPLRGIALQ